MDFSLNQDHDDVRRTVRDFLRKAGSETDVRRIMETSAGYDLDGWETLCSDLGVVAIGVPGHLGGIDLGFEALSVVMEELGAALYPSPLFATRILATEALLRTADESVADVVEGFVSGASIGALALSDYTGCWTPERVSVTATARDGDHTLTGLASFVVDGAVADVVVVVADLDGAPSIFLVDHGATGYETQPLQTVDLDSAPGSTAVLRHASTARRAGRGRHRGDPARAGSRVDSTGRGVGRRRATLPRSRR